MISAVLIDDDLYALNRLESMLNALEEEKVEVVATFQDPMVAYTFLQKYKPDLLFLDIRMPGLNGFELLDVLEIGADVIFVTSYDVYAIQAIRYSAFDYLLKPVNTDALKDSIIRFRDKHNNTSRITQLHTLQHNLRQTEVSRFRIILPGHKETIVLDAFEITHCIADSNYTHFYLSTGKRILASKTLGDVEHLLPTNLFIRIHKSYLVNLQFLHSLKGEPSEAILTNGIKLPVSRRRLQEVKMALSEKNH